MITQKQLVSHMVKQGLSYTFRISLVLLIPFIALWGTEPSIFEAIKNREVLGAITPIAALVITWGGALAIALLDKEYSEKEHIELVKTLEALEREEEIRKQATIIAYLSGETGDSVKKE